ncbi:MAG: S8 family peptidase [archaeon]
MELKKEVLAMLILFFMIIFLIGSLTQQTRAQPSVNVDNYQDSDYVPREVIVKYKGDVIGNGNEVLLKNKNEIVVYEYVEKPVGSERIGDGEVYNLKFSDGEVSEIIKNYEMMEEIEYAEPNYIFKSYFQTSVIPNDASYSLKWGLMNINSEKAWNLTTGNSSVSIAIIDTGVDWNHPDLSLNIWNNTDEGCDDTTDADGNGYNGDCRGYDFVNVSSGCSASDDCNTEDNNPMDYQTHGTHCAGIASAVSNNNLGVTGACWNCSIMPVRAGYEDLTGRGSLALTDVVQALYYATNNSATIISMSFGGSHSVTMQAAINDSYTNGSILVASSGNDGANSAQYPCAYDNVICIAAIDSDNSSASYSNYGTWVDLAAPGTSIYSTYFDDTYVAQSGTSMATPMVAGSIGLIKSLFSKNQTQVKSALNDTGTAVDFNGVSINRIDIYSAILSLDNINPNVSLISPLNNKNNLSVNQTFTCNSSDWQLKNITFSLWNSSDDIYYNESRSITGIFNETGFNITDLVYDSYKWNCLVYDDQDNGAYASSNFSLFVQNISVILISPLNNTKTNQLTEFNCSSETENNKRLSNITFSLWNSTELVYNKTNSISGISNSSNFSYNFNMEDNYLWNCQSYNNATDSVKAINFSILYDATSPNISLLDPTDSSSYTSNSQTINFGFNVSDNNDISNCSLIINNVVSLTNTSVDKSLIQNISQSFVPGSYNWNINCSDESGNVFNSSLRGFTVTAPAVQTASTGGGGGGGSASKTYVISDEQASEGYTKSLSKDDKIKFNFFDKENIPHNLILNEIKEEYIEITIQSNPIKLKLGIGQSAKLNLTSPDYYDLYVKLNSIENKKAELTIQIIHEDIITQPKVTGDVVKEDEILTVDEEVTGLDNEVEKLKRNIYILVLVIIGVVIFVVFLEIKHIKNKIKETNLFEHKEKFNKEVRPKKKESKDIKRKKNEAFKTKS